MLDHFEDAGLEILHNGVGPEAGVLVESSGETLVAGEVEDDIGVGDGLDDVLAI